MPSAVIGSLRVDLGVNTAKLSTGLGQAQTKFAKFGAVGALGVAIKKAIDEADAMDEAAQKIGLTTEELSKLQYAAGFSGVGLDQLTGSIGKLDAAMFKASNGNKAMAAAFANAGIAFANADGSLRSANDVLMDLADHFASMPDGAQKTGEAMALMGKSGAQMIPVLNAGSAGLKLLGEEAIRAGVVLSTKTAKAAGDFNDSLDRLKAGVKGQVMQLTAYLAPAMAQIARGAVVVSLNLNNMRAISAEVWDRMIEMAQGFKTALDAIATSLPNAFIAAFKTIVHAAATAFTAIPGSLGEQFVTEPLKKLDEFAAGLGGGAEFDNAMTNAKILIEDAMRPLETIIQPLEAAGAALDNLGGSAEGAAGGGGGGGGGGGVSELTSALQELQSEAEGIFQSTRTPVEEFAQTMASLNGHVQSGRITWDTYNRAVIQAQDTLTEAGAEADNTFRNMQDDFGDMAADVVQGTATMQEAFSRMLSNMAGDLIASGIKNMMLSLFGGGSGGPASAIPWLASLGGAALGTQFASGGPMLVGERGPEVVHLPRGAKVTPNGELGGGGTFNFAPVYNAPGADAQQLAQLRAENAAQWASFKATFRSNVVAATGDRRNRGSL